MPARRGRPRKSKPDPAKQPIESFKWYATGVINGEIPACQYIIQACQRHYRDIDANRNGGDWYFDEMELVNVQAFASMCTHQKGELAGEPIVLEPWQLFVVGSVLCWKSTQNGRRRFKTAYVEVPRKNGKSVMLSIIGLWGMVADGEKGAEIYSAATKKDQAREVFDVAVNMVKHSPGLKRYIDAFKHNLSSKTSMSKFEPLGRDSDTMDGKNPHFALVDEYHAHKTRETYEVLESGMGARLQPVMWVITTAGFLLHGPCKISRDTYIKILDPENDIQNESIFAFISTIDDEDDPFLESSWIKANPNYGVSVLPDNIKQAAEDAQMMPAAQNNFLTKRLNIWVGQAERWLPMKDWRACAAEPKPFKGRLVVAGGDLATTTDLVALAAAAEDEDGTIDVRCHFWAPREKAMEREKSDSVPYTQWARDGFLTLHDGPVVDYDRLRVEWGEQCDKWGCQEIGIDPWNATQLAAQLVEDGYDMVQVRQTVNELNAPCKHLYTRVLEHKVRHGGHPILDWNADGAAIYTDSSGSIKPDKNKAPQRIDGIVALVNALARLLVTDREGPSIYASRGLTIL